MRVWDLDALELESELRMKERLPAGQRVLVEDIVVDSRGEVWAVVGGELLAWGRKPTPAVRDCRIVSEINAQLAAVGSGETRIYYDGFKAALVAGSAGSGGPDGSAVSARTEASRATFKYLGEGTNGQMLGAAYAPSISFSIELLAIDMC